MNKFIILHLAGLGDTLSSITRLPAVKEKYPNHEIVFYLGGFGKSVEFSKQQIQREGYKANIIKNFNFHNQIKNMKEFINKNVVKEGDILEDWSFCEEIFQNKEPIFFQYDMQFPYQYKTTQHPYDDRIECTPNKTIAIHPLTKSGNAEGFESDVSRGRFWSRDEWKKLCVRLCDSGYTPAFVGYGDEDWGLIEELSNEGYNVLDKRMDVEDTIYFLQTVSAGIFCNSWDWEVTSRIGIPTFCFYTKNHFFIQNHVPHGFSDFWNTCYIETRQSCDFQSVYDKITYIIENKNKPQKNYSIAMITYDDIDCIQETLDSIEEYVIDDFVVVDGGSSDGTLEIIKSKSNIKLFEKKWEDNFEIQKNYALDNTKNEWRILIDADEKLEHILWNQLGWHIWEAEKEGVDCITLPRINIVNGLTQDFVKQNNWQLSFFNWVNYPDGQDRLYKRNCRYRGRTHERIVGSNKKSFIMGQHIIHIKDMKRQQRGIDREHYQYKVEADKIKSKITNGKKIKIHYINNLNSNEYTDNLRYYFINQEKDDNILDVLCYDAINENTEKDFFDDIVQIPYGSIPELMKVISEIKPSYIKNHSDKNQLVDYMIQNFKLEEV